jgi:RimJ/RimL family protein N-acetyltransferase
VTTPLTLVPLTADSIRALSSRPEDALSQPGLTGLIWPQDDRRVLRYRAEALAADPAGWRWLLHAALDGDGNLVGRIGCHAAPVDGGVEVGYSVRPHARGRGLGTRLLADFSDWLSENGVDRVVLTVRPDNVASLRIARGAGFVETGERWDEEDGLELVLERALAPGTRAPGSAPGRPPGRLPGS